MGLAIFATCFSTFFGPTIGSYLPSLVRDERELGPANSAWASLDNLAFVVGPVLAGVLVAIGGLTVAFVLNAVSFLIVDVILWRLPSSGSAAPDAVTGLRPTPRPAPPPTLSGGCARRPRPGLLRRPVSPLRLRARHFPRPHFPRPGGAHDRSGRPERHGRRRQLRLRRRRRPRRSFSRRIPTRRATPAPATSTGRSASAACWVPSCRARWCCAPTLVLPSLPGRSARELVSWPRVRPRSHACAHCADRRVGREPCPRGRQHDDLPAGRARSHPGPCPGVMATASSLAFSAGSFLLPVLADRVGVTPVLVVAGSR